MSTRGIWSPEPAETPWHPDDPRHPLAQAPRDVRPVDRIDPEGHTRYPPPCVCGAVYTYAGIPEPGGFDPSCPVHGEEHPDDFAPIDVSRLPQWPCCLRRGHHHPDCPEA